MWYCEYMLLLWYVPVAKFDICHVWFAMFDFHKERHQKVN